MSTQNSNSHVYLEALRVSVPEAQHKKPWFLKAEDFASEMDECRRISIVRVKVLREAVEAYFKGVTQNGCFNAKIGVHDVDGPQEELRVARSKVHLLLELHTDKRTVHEFDSAASHALKA